MRPLFQEPDNELLLLRVTCESAPTAACHRPGLPHRQSISVLAKICQARTLLATRLSTMYTVSPNT